METTTSVLCRWLEIISESLTSHCSVLHSCTVLCRQCNWTRHIMLWVFQGLNFLMHEGWCIGSFHGNSVWRSASLLISFNQLESHWETVTQKFIIYGRTKTRYNLLHLYDKHSNRRAFKVNCECIPNNDVEQLLATKVAYKTTLIYISLLSIMTALDYRKELLEVTTGWPHLH